jgi:hypothetical protein
MTTPILIDNINAVPGKLELTTSATKHRLRLARDLKDRPHRIVVLSATADWLISDTENGDYVTVKADERWPIYLNKHETDIWAKAAASTVDVPVWVQE